MARRAGLALAWLGLSAVAMLSVTACFVDVTQDKKGVCEDDGNPCTEDICATGAAEHKPKADGEVCVRGTNAGTCKAGDCTLACGHPGEPDCDCVSDDDCQKDNPCSDWSCDDISKKCINMMMPDDTPAGMSEQGDCQKLACRMGTPEPQSDPMDVPANVIGDCQKYYCDNISVKTMNDPGDTPADNPGDCKKYACIDSKAVEMPDDNDKPPPTDCVTNTCAGGVIIPMTDPPGTACMNKTRACNTEGKCADCLNELEHAACIMLNVGSCPVKKCNGASCVLGSECQSNSCADGRCCNTSCQETCKSCALMGMEGTCSNIPFFQPDSSPQCNFQVQGSYCNGKGECLRAAGRPCNEGTQCLSGSCSNMQKCLGAPGEVCGQPEECVSTMCVMGECK